MSKADLVFVEKGNKLPINNINVKKKSSKTDNKRKVVKKSK